MRCPLSVDVPGVGLKGALEKTTRLHHRALGNRPLVEASLALKIEFRRVGVRCVRCAPRFGSDQLRPQLIRKPSYNFILHIEQVSHGLIEALGPEVRAALRIDELDVYAKPITGALDAALQHVTDVQLAPDLLHVEGFALVGECRVARYHERAGDARQIGGEALGYAVNEVFLLGSPPMLAKGKTTMERRGALVLSHAEACGTDAGPAEPVLTA
jgi:hypothetical protein